MADWNCGWKRTGDDLADEIRVWRNEKVRVEELSADEARQLEPGLRLDIAAVYRLPDLGQVRNPRLVKALLAACAERGVRLFPERLSSGSRRGKGGSRAAHADRRSGGRALLRRGGRVVRGNLEFGWRASPHPAGSWADRARFTLPRLFSHVLQIGAALSGAARRRANLDRRDRGARRLFEGQHGVGGGRPAGVRKEPRAGAGRGEFDGLVGPASRLGRRAALSGARRRLRKPVRRRRPLPQRAANVTGHGPLDEAGPLGSGNRRAARSLFLRSRGRERNP